MVSLPTLGVNFSHRHAEWLGLDPDALLRAACDELGVRRFRLSAYWDEIAPAPGALDVGPLRRWLDPLEERGVRVLLTVGIKAQRHPEFYPPAWLERDLPLPHGANLEEHPRVVAHLLLMLERVTAFAAGYDCIDAWQVENEPFLPAARRTAGWHISPGLLAREIAVVREADPRRRPIVVNHASLNRLDRAWWDALSLGDVLAQNIYTRKPNRWPRLRALLPYFNAYSPWWPFGPALGRQARVATRLGRELWVTELQAEPWESVDLRPLSAAQIGSISPARLGDNLALARRTGARRIYLWGLEWWRFKADRGDRHYWEQARKLFAPDSAKRGR